jgi:hypothetical protein
METDKFLPKDIFDNETSANFTIDYNMRVESQQIVIYRGFVRQTLLFLG